MNKQVNNMNSTHPRKESDVMMRSRKGDGVKLVLTLIGVLSILCIAGKTWVWNDKSQIASEENDASWKGLEANATSIEMSYAYVPGRHGRHDRIHRDFFVWSEGALSHDVNEVQLK